MPTHGVFVENRLSAFRKKYGADVKVIAPVPWFPFQNETFGKYAAWARAPEMETREGVEIFHPRYLIPPKVGMGYAPTALAHCLRKTARTLIKSDWVFDLIDAHYLYPDGVAAAQVAAEFGKPVVVTARGGDINLLPDYPGPRRKIVNAAMKADAIITVASALKRELVRLGAPEQKITVLRNGVDLELFKPLDRATLRKDMNLSGPVIASVGHLIARKGHHLVIEALKDIPGATLLIAGDGEQRQALKALAKRLGVADHVRFLGLIPHDKLTEVYNAVDVFALASSREGWPNVLLEAMACGAPCVATDVWGSGEVIREPAAGRLVQHRTPEAMAKAINHLLADPPDRAATRRYAQAHSWNDTVDGMENIFSALTKKARAAIKTTPVRFSNSAYKPKLIVTVDTEEQFDWSDFNSAKHKIAPVSDIAVFQSLCRGEGVSPLYFLTYPLLADAKTADYFRALQERKKAACGLHLHPWATPPVTDFSGEYFSFQKNLPREAHLEKLQHLASAFENIFGERANAHRAGRYGIAPENYALLAEIGVKYDFSPSAGFDFSNIGGPDFSACSNQPFALRSSGALLFVTPVSGARAIQKTRIFLSQENSLPGFAPPTASVLPNLTKPMRLSPEGASLDDLKALTKKLVADKTPVLTFTLHSTSLTIGANSYAQDAASVQRLLDVTRQYFRWFRDQQGGDFVSLDDLAAFYENASETAGA